MDRRACASDITVRDILRARTVVQRFLPRTPLYRYPLLSVRLGFDAFVKHENHLPVGSFKARGAVNLFANLTEAERRRGVVCATRGNHGLAIAWASRAFGARSVIYVPKGNNPDKNALTEAMGAEVVVHGRDFDEAAAEAEARARNDGLRYVHTACEPLLMAGHATYALEIVEDLPDVDAVIVPVGCGSGIAGCAVVMRAMRPEVRVLGVQAERAPALARSLERGELTSCSSADTFADGLATRFAFELPFRILRACEVPPMTLVSEEEIREGVRLALETTHNLAEGAAAAAYAAALKNHSDLHGKRVAIVHTGHNIDRGTLRWALGMFEA